MKNLPKDSEIIMNAEKLTVFDVIVSFMKKHGATDLPEKGMPMQGELWKVYNFMIKHIEREPNG